MIDFLKINDPKVWAVSVKDNREDMVDLLTEYPDIYVDHSRAYAPESSPSISMLRASVAKKLHNAQKHLPEGVLFKVIECYRPLFVQKELFLGKVERLKKQHADWDETRLYDEASLFVAPPADVPPHSTGGTLDITLMSADGKELDMGTQLDQPASELCFTASTDIPLEARQNRGIMGKALSQEGFINYPAEWWHWSYGDKYWAYQTNNPLAIYGTFEL